MKALTVQQPWAWAIIHGGKNIENRTQLWKYRGPLAIHAAKSWSDHGCSDQRVLRAYTQWLGFDHWYGPTGGASYGPIDPTYETDAELLDSGALIGVVDLVDVHISTPTCCQPWGEFENPAAARLISHLVLENPRTLAEPIPLRGQLGLWTPPADVVTRLEAL